MDIKALSYDLINRAKANGGSAIIDCGTPEMANEVRDKVKQAIKFYSNLDVTVVREKEVNLYSWTIHELARDANSNNNDIHKDHNVGGNTRGGRRGHKRSTSRNDEPVSGRDPGFGF
tara:strand:- start:8401 stop:8751 length:351 start_codon:yes stop_codon:yes gene_type:complete